MGLSRGLSYSCFYMHNSNLMEVLFHFHQDFNKVSVTKFSTWYASTDVVTWAVIWWLVIIHSYIEAQTNMFKCIFLNEKYYILVIISLIFVPMGSTDDAPTLFQVMAWCLTAPSHYLKQCWQCFMMAYGFTRPQWVKSQQPVDSIRYEFDKINFHVGSNTNITSFNLSFGIFNLQKGWSCGTFYKKFLIDVRNKFCCNMMSKYLIPAHICKCHDNTGVIM